MMRIASKASTIVVLVAGLFVACSHAQVSYLAEPNLLWSSSTTDAEEDGLGVRHGNGLYMSPDGNMLVSTSFDGTVRAFDPMTGDVLWTYAPNSLGFPIRCLSGVTFNMQSATPYLVYSVADAATDLVDNPLAESRVIALDMSGAEIFQSAPLAGVVAGTPVTDYVGSHILVTHNEDRFNGFLSIFFLGNLTVGEPLQPVFSGIYQDTLDDGTVIQKPFSPIGYFHNPAEGYYTGGEDNRNDMFLFCWDTPRAAENVGANDGQLFAVQFPTDYAYDGEGLTFFPLGNTTDFQSPNPPILSNAGRSYYWAVTKSAHDVVVGVEGLDRFRFDRNRRTNRVGFDRAPFPFPIYAAALAPPTLSSDPNEPVVFGVGANAQIWRMNYNYSESSRMIQPTSDIVSARVVLSPQEDSVWYATQAFATPGRLHMLSADTLQEVWSVTIDGGVEGDMVMSSGGTILYLATPSGDLLAYQVADTLETPITRAPTDTTTAPFPSNVTAPPDTTPFPTITPPPTSSPAPDTTTNSSTVEPTMTPEMNTTAPTTSAPSPGPNTTFEKNSTAPTLAPVTASPSPEAQFTEVVLAGNTSVPTYAPSAPESEPVTLPESNPNLLQIVESQSDLSTLEMAVLSSDIYWLLNQTLAEFTVFAPTNTAFDELGRGTLSKYLTRTWKVHLENLLLFHVADGSLFAENVTNGMMIETVLQFGSGPADNITAIVNSSSSLDTSIVFIGSSFQGSEIVEADLIATNGVIHKVDQVFIPYTLTLNLLKRVAQVDDFSILSGLIVTAGLDELLSTAGTLTLFGPNDSGFAAVDPAILESLRQDTEALQVVLLNHLVEGNNWDLARMSNGRRFTSLAGNTLRVTTSNQGREVYVGGARIVVHDQVASNGLFHIIDAVLIPDTTTPPNATEAPNATALPEATQTPTFPSPTLAPNATSASNATDATAAPETTVAPLLSDVPSDVPSSFPSTVPLTSPTAASTSGPSFAPSDTPSDLPSDQPSDIPSSYPSQIPSVTLTSAPTSEPTLQPSYQPSNTPTRLPSGGPTLEASTTPSAAPLTSEDLDCSFQQDTSLPGLENLILRQYVNQVENTVTIQVVYGGLGWVGIGFSEDGSMVGNLAVIGLPDDNTVAAYDLGAKALSAITPAVNVQLTDASIVQTETETILTFTRSVLENNETVVEGGATSRIIFAVGAVNYLSYHVARGSADVAFDACAVIV